MLKILGDRIRFYTVLSVTLWTIFVAMLLFLDVEQTRSAAMDLAMKEAVTNINKDMTFRRWASSHGGVYVPETKQTPPNPYLNDPERDVVTTTGKRLTLLNPAYMVRQMQEGYSDTFGVRGHLTSLKLINPVNAPDSWERAALEAFEQGESERTSVSDIDGTPFLRAMRPIKIELPCLKCHKQQGYKVGDIAGGVSASVNSLPYLVRAQQEEKVFFASYGGILVVGYIGIAFFNRRARRFEEDRNRADAQLHLAASVFESAHDGMVVTDSNNVILRVNRAFTEITGYSAEEVIGKTPSLLKSGRHDDLFYSRMWASLRHQGIWQGEIFNRRKNGEVYPEWLSINVVKAGSGKVTNYAATLTDLTLRKAAEEQIKDLAFYDPLTHLPNRRLLRDRLQQALATSNRSGRAGALLIIDLDNFRALNDTLGHDVGDLLLQQVTQRLVANIRDGDTVARLGGDEFVIMLEDLSKAPKESATEVEYVGEKILSILNKPFLLTGHEYISSASIGATLFNDHEHTVDELLKRADLAMYQAKLAGRNTLRFFDPEMQAVVTARARLEGELRRGLQQNEFVLYYQSQVDKADRVTGAEVLVRWNHPSRGLISPAAFIPLAEETGLILPLGYWVLETACTQIASWSARPEMACLTLAVNVSARQFHHPDFVEQVLAVLEHTGADPQKLKLELTESLLLNDVEDIVAKMNTLKAKGVCFSLDDFGTGYSSLSYLKRLPLDQLKIDKSFVRDILSGPNDAAIAKTIVALTQSLGLSVIAEGVEMEAQRDFLADFGCHAYQGYYFSQPLPLKDFELLV